MFAFATRNDETLSILRIMQQSHYMFDVKEGKMGKITQVTCKLF